MWNPTLFLLFLAVVYGLALFCVFRTLLNYRTTQGAIAWIISLLAFPYLALPLFFMFGRNRFSGYVQARRSRDVSLNHLLSVFQNKSREPHVVTPASLDPDLQVLTSLARQPFTSGNQCSLLQDGKATFEALFEAMENATDYLSLIHI